ncbi:iron-containing alcohol dehydrogenase [Brevibacillus sp. SYSU BS000544]|uniref:iron-containing alcohol dehydrogenase n=1 Tax=Brevibacillus sp. SYSU BS000544 TaxID=3416443 RepID=UPI003CE47DD8
MFPFELSFTTRIIFGTGELARIGEEVKTLGKKAFLVTGGKSAKASGLVDRVIDYLTSAQVEFVLFDKVEPNPRTTTVDEGARLAREHHCDVVLAVGGGSVMDAAKAIALSAHSGRPIYDYMRGNPNGLSKESAPISSALPIVTVPTVAATGSEANELSVLTNWETHEKSSISGSGLLPKIAIMDPSLTYTVPPNVTAEACADIFSHLFEAYVIDTHKQHVQDGFTESLIRQVVAFAKIAMDQPDNEEARATLLWTSTLAISPFTLAGRSGRYPLHQAEHTLSGYYDISHGRGLAILSIPYFQQIILEDRPDRLARMGRECFGVRFEDDRQAAEATIEAIAAWYRELGITQRLSDFGITRESLPVMARDSIRIGGRGADHIKSSRSLYESDILALYEACF